MARRDRGMAMWGVHDDAGNCVAIVTHVGRNSWWVEDYQADIAARFRSKSQAFYFAQHVIS